MPKQNRDSGPAGTTKTITKDKVKSTPLPPYKVLLHNDDVNDMDHVVRAIMELVHLNQDEARLRMWEAHTTGVSMLIVTHKERAELLAEQFHSKNLTATIEPA